jgi:hypothetical protein
LASLYLVTEHDAWGDRDSGFYEHFDNIRKLQPDIVILWLAFEFSIRDNWHHLPALLNNWISRENIKTRVFLFAGDVFNSEHGLLGRHEHVYTNIFTMTQYMNIGSYGNSIHKNQPIDAEPFLDINLQAEKLFVTMNNQPKPHRVSLLDRIFELDWQDKCVYSAVHFDKPETLRKMPVCKAFTPHSKRLTDSNPGVHDLCDVPPEYNQGLIDIVTETCVLPKAFFPTEKTIRPIMMLKPFIAVSCPHYHAMLSDKFGIELYTEMFDYEYVDNIDDLTKRTHAVLDQVLAFYETFNSAEQRTQVLDSIAPKLLHNAKKLWEHHFTSSYVIRDELAEILDQVLVSNETLDVHSSNIETMEGLFDLMVHPYADKVRNKEVQPNHIYIDTNVI